MGEVWLARDRHLDRDVAVKVARPGASEWLVREARRMAALDHPGIVAVHDLGTTPDGDPYYAMRLVRGQTLADAIAAASEPGHRLRLLEHVLDAAHAVAWAHTRGELHLDLKPANVMVGGFGETQVLDWGLGASEGGVVGTPAYMSPEQARGQPGTALSDVWGLGALLYAVLSGRAPRPGGVNTALDAARLAPAPVRSAAPSAPPELCAIVDRALRHDPEARYPSASAFAADLTRYMAGERIEAHRYSAFELLSRLVRLWRVPLAVAAAGGAALLAAGVVFTTQLAAERDRATAAYRRSLVAQALLEAQRDHWPEAEVLAAQGDGPEARGVLVGAAAFGAPRRVESRALGDCPNLVWFGEQVACADGQRVWTTGGAEVRSSATRVVPVGDHLVLAEPDSWRVVEADGAELARVPGPQLAGEVAKSAAGYVASVGIGVTQWWADVASGAVHFVEECDGVTAAAALHPTEARRAALCADGTLLEGPVAGPLVPLVTTPFVGDVDGGVSTMVYAGRDLVLATHRGDLAIASASGVRLTPRDAPGAASLAVSADGRLAVSRVVGPIEVWRLDAIGSGAGPFAWVPAAARRVIAFGADGALLVADPTHLERWTIEDPGRAAEIRFDTGLASLAYDGDRLWVGDGRGRLVQIDPRSGGITREVRAGGSAVKAIVASEGAVSAISGLGVQRWATDGARMPGLAEGAAIQRLVGVGGDLVALAVAPAEARAWDASGAPVALDCPPVEWVDASGGATGALLGADERVQRLAGRRCTAGPRVAGATAVAAGPDGGWVVADEGGVTAFDAEGARRWRAPVSTPRRVGWSPDGRWVAVGTRDGSVVVIGSDGEVAAVLRQHRERISALAFSDDGAWLASASWDRTVRQWPLAALDRPAAEVRAELAERGYALPGGP